MMEGMKMYPTAESIIASSFTNEVLSLTFEEVRDDGTYFRNALIPVESIKGGIDTCIRNSLEELNSKLKGGEFSAVKYTEWELKRDLFNTPVVRY